MATPLVGLYPGSFDPITNGHTDVIKRAAKICDRLVVGVAINTGKDPMFTIEERVEIVKEEILAHGHGIEAKVEVLAFRGLLMHYAREVGARIIVRGLRAVTDFDYEFQMTGMNARLDPDIETVFLMASEKHQFISSRLVKEVGILGGDVRPFVSSRVAEHLVKRIAEREAARGE
ncbi:MAG: pantetheine-phosphate adenylyltransferase [Proteobacteria bacterium]|nr:pantetheine-phosphate adenylyltransferase [Pseudomonadota bacterium]